MYYPAVSVAVPLGVKSQNSGSASSAVTRRHQDYLHYCLPGPTDGWILLLQAALEAANRLEEPAGAVKGA